MFKLCKPYQSCKQAVSALKRGWIYIIIPSIIILYKKSFATYGWKQVPSLTASVAAWCLLNYLDEQITKKPNLEWIGMWSDGCSAQNRNVTLLSAISIWAKQHSKQFLVKYPKTTYTNVSRFCPRQDWNSSERLRSGNPGRLLDRKSVV